MLDSRLSPPKLNPLPQDTAVERDIFSFQCVLLESVWSDVVASILEHFSEITVASSVRLASFEVWEATDEIRLPASRTAIRMKIAPERFSLMNKSLLFLYRRSVNDGRTGFCISCISFQEVNIGMYKISYIRLVRCNNII